MVESSKILTVSYGTFSCTLEGFDDSFTTMKAIAEYFRDLAAGDRYFGAIPPVPDVEMLSRIAEREVSRRVEARASEDGIHLRAAPQDQIAASPAPVMPPEMTRPATAPAMAAMAAAPARAAAAERATESPAAPAPAPQAPTAQAPAAAIPLPPAPEAPVADEAAAEVSRAAPPAHPDPDSVAAKLQRIRAVVGRSAGTGDAYIEDLPDRAFFAPEPAEAAAPAPVAEEPARDDTDAQINKVLSNLRRAGASVPDDVTIAPRAPAAAPAEGATDPTRRARILRVTKRTVGPTAAMTVSKVAAADPGKAQAEAPSAPAAAQTAAAPAPVATDDRADLAFLDGADELADQAGAAATGLSPEDEADLMAELAAAEAAEAGLDAVAAIDDVVPQSAAEAPEPVQDDIAEALDEAERDDAALGDVALDESEGDDAALADVALDEAEVDEAEADQAEPVAAELDEADADEVSADEAGADEVSVEDDRAADAAPDADADEDEAEAELKDFADALTEDDEHSEHVAFAPVAPRKDPTSTGDPFTDGLYQRGRTIADAIAARAAATAGDPTARQLTGPAVDHMEFRPRGEKPGERPAAEPARPGRPERAATLPRTDDATMSRIMEQTDAELSDPEASRRRAAIAQLKAAVAATEAARRLGEKTAEAPDQSEAFREDLSKAVQPRRAPRPAAPELRSERPRPAPLKLVASQRVDMAAAASDGPVRPRRVTMATEAAKTDATSFSEFAKQMGAVALPDLLEAAAAYTAFVEGEPEFSRPQIMKKVQASSTRVFSREDGLRSFGTLLRQGRISKVGNGRFQISDATRFKPEAKAG